uniref:phage tail-collar fiber domain-containing protein n=1 Tax=uncultured Veillonella sp. TaxID=159268 RepID=UPI0028D5810B
MAEWSNATMTDVGAALQAKVNAGKTKLTFTKIKVGSGVNATNPLALTDVISSKWETTNFVVKLEGKIVSVDTVITNTGIHEAFRMSEIGLFAQDPDKGEILYAYLTDPEPDRMPAESGSVVVSQELTIGMVFSNTGNVSLTVNIGALITREQLTEAVKQHNTDISSHPPITDQIKAILGSANWKDSPASTLVTIKNLLGQGAIVASKLDANAGFVKFANGFTIQWGLTWFLNQNTYCDLTL